MNKSYIKLIFILTILCSISSCKKFVEIGDPKSDLAKSTIFANDASALSSIMGLYYYFTNNGYANGSISSLTYQGTVLGDEALNYRTTVNETQFATNSLLPLNSYMTHFWNVPYYEIYMANNILESISISPGVSPAMKTRLEGEAKFFRAFSYFYLVNLFGDVPLALTTDYATNLNIPRTPVARVYQQIIKDLEEAEALIHANYLNANNTTISIDRSRINKATVTAMLARVYLYTGNWAKAEAAAGQLIGNALYQLPSLGQVFLKNSQEAIWQLSNDIYNPAEGNTFRITTRPTNCSLRPEWVQGFDNTDLRRSVWITGIAIQGITYYYPSKYNSNTLVQPITEYSTVLRLAEQYLIRAEARIQQENISEGIADLNALRKRARTAATPAIPSPLPDWPSDLSKSDALLAVEKERQLELFTEWGHRWLDLKRTNRANTVLAPLKGVNWQTTDQLFPIPQTQILNDPAMAAAQNPGY